MARFGIAARLALILIAALVAAQLLMLAAYVVERRRATEETRFAPLVAQITALTMLLDKVPHGERDLVLRAAAGVGFSPRVTDGRPAISQSFILRPVRTRLTELLGGRPDRFIALALLGTPDHEAEPGEQLNQLAGARLHVVVELNDGTYLDLYCGGEITVRLLGLPVGMLAGILGFLVALAALVAVRRETRPLSDLADAVEHFGTRLEPKPVPERGAPDVRLVIRSVNAMQARIADLVRTRSLVLGAISHDLRTYLTRLKLRMELLPPSTQTAKATADLDDMQALVDDALSFARASFAGASDETVDLSLLARTEHDIRLAQGATVTLTGAGTPHVVQGSPGSLARVMANLVGNALAYGGRADIALSQTPKEVTLTIEDRGPGIPADERGNVFEPFYRLEPSRNRESGGAGLGLTIVAQIVEAHKGRIVIGDRPGGGARIAVILPRGEG